MSSEVLHYEDVKFRRDGREILKGVDWHVEEGGSIRPQWGW